MIIETTEIYVVQTLACTGPAVGDESWQDEREFAEDGPAFDWADYLREDSETVARVVRRWR